VAPKRNGTCSNTYALPARLGGEFDLIADEDMRDLADAITV
jgi:hypothetical protein